MQQPLTHHATHRHPTETSTPDPRPNVPSLRTQAALVAAPPLALWALSHPTAALLAMTVLTVLAWHRLVAQPRPLAQPAQPPD
jgi:hypothetical protein